MKNGMSRNRASRFHLRLNQPLGLIRARVRLGLGGGNLGGDFSSEVVNALFDAFTNDEERVAADLGAGRGQRIGYGIGFQLPGTDINVSGGNFRAAVDNRLIVQINIGFGNMVASSRLIAIVSPESAPVKRTVQEARDRGMVVDGTYGRRTRAVLIMDSDHVVLSALQPETVAARFAGETEEGEPEDA